MAVVDRRRRLGVGQVAAAHPRAGGDRRGGRGARWSPRSSRASPTGCATRLRPPNAGRPARARCSDRDAPEHRRRLVVVLDRYDPRAGWARSPLATELLAAAGPHSAITVICVVGPRERRADPSRRAGARRRRRSRSPWTAGGRPGRPGQPTCVADWPRAVLCEAIARELAPLRLSAEGEEILAQMMSLPSMLGIADLDDSRRRGAVGRGRRRGRAADADRLRRQRRAAACWTSRSRRRAAWDRTA